MRRIMYIEDKSNGLSGPGYISWVKYSQSKRSIYWRGHELLKCVGYKYNAVDCATGTRYWISGPKKRGGDRLYGGIVEIDDDAREEYWTTVRGMPNRIKDTKYRS